MTFRTLIHRSLRFHWRSHLGVVLGAAIGSAALIGALVVGDSVKGSLRERALERLGWTTFALQSGDRLVTETLVDKLILSTIAEHRASWTTNRESSRAIESLFYANAVISKQDGSARVNRVNLYVGTPPVINWSEEENTWFNFDIPKLSEQEQQAQEQLIQALKAEGATNQMSAALVARYVRTQTNDQEVAFLNEALAKQLQAKVGDTILMRFQKPSALSADTAVSQRNEQSVSVRLRVGAIVPAYQTGNFSLQSSQIAPLNVFIGRHTFTNLTGNPFRPNTLTAAWVYRDWPAWSRWRIWNQIPLLGWAIRSYEPALHSYPIEELNRSISKFWRLEDCQAELRSDQHSRWFDLRSERIFLDPPLSKAAELADKDSNRILTLLANLLRVGTNTTPYSMVTAAGAPWTPANLRDDEIVVSQWLADDLHVKPGDEIALSYFLPESGAKLEEATNTFRVHSIVPLEMPWADRTLMPNFPGIEKAESTSEWDAGFPLTYEVRKKDDDYWKQYRGTPKAFVTLAAGQKMWGNRFGNLTAIRFPITGLESRLQAESSSVATNTPDRLKAELQTIENYRATLEKKILGNLKPEELGLRFEPVREQALKAANESQDFGGLFLGFSFFLIIAALLLMAMLFQFGLEQRAPEIGTLLALGFTPKQVRKLLLREGVALAFFGGIAGAVGGIYFAKTMLHGLTTVWRDAVGATALSFHFTGQTLVIGIFASVVVSTITIWLALRNFVKRAPRELLVGEIQGDESKVQSPRSKVVAVIAMVLALGLVGWMLTKGDKANAGAFFGAGALVLIAGLSFVSAWLVRFSRVEQSAAAQAGALFTTLALAVRGCARRRKRSLATVAMLACGSFLIVSIGVFRLDANRDATQKTSGTGGFAMIGETTLPVVQDLNSASGRDFFALNEQDLPGVTFVPFRVRAGDEASCLNLNRAQKPRLLGVNSEFLAGRFTFAKTADGSVEDKPWQTLERGAFYPMHGQPLAEDEVAAIGDANSIQWAMGKKVDDTIDYVDERGQPFKVRIVGAVANSILQGQLIIDESEFVKRFPGESGYRMFLIDAPSNAVSQVSATLSRAMQDVGLELTPTATRLNQFNAVQNTYLGTFQVLGGLGLLLGSVGLGIVVLRNVLERRSELAVLLAVGFRRQQVQRLLLMENGALLLLGLLIGVVAAAIAVLPALLSPGAQFPLTSLAITLGAVLLNGSLWTWAATRYAVRGDLLAALRND